MGTTTRVSFLGGASALLWAGAVHAQAQNADAAVATESAAAGLADIVVTANRRSENLQRVPATIVAVSAEALKSKGIATLTDLDGAIANVRIGGPYGATQPNITIRGIGVANVFDSNGQTPVGVYFDDIYQGFRPAHGAAVFDLDRLEVLKGPQGTLFGRNTTGGAINYITRRPGLAAPNGYISAGTGNYGLFTMSGAAEATLVPDRLGVRAAFSRHFHMGYINNVTGRAGQGVPNRFVGSKDFDSDDGYGARLSIRWKPDPAIEINVRGYISRDDPIASPGVEQFIGPNNTNPLTGYSRAGLGRRDVAADGQGRFKTQVNGTSARIDWSLGDFALRSSTGYNRERFAQVYDFDGSPQSLGAYNRKVFRHTGLSQDLALTYDVERIKLITGLYYSREKVHTYGDVTLLGVLNAFAPNNFNLAGFYGNTRPPSGINNLEEFDQIQNSFAAYADAKVALTDRLSLTAGARFTRDQLHFNNYYSLVFDSSMNPVGYYYTSIDPASGTIPNLPILPQPPLFPSALGVLPNQQVNKNAVTGRVILDFQASDDTLLYLGYSRGYRSGAYNGQNITNVPGAVDPEYVDAIEGGVKTRMFDRRLQINTSLFYNIYNGQQVSEVFPTAEAFLRNLDGKSYGAEIEIAARPADWVTLNLSGGYLHSRYSRVLLGDTRFGGVAIDIGGNPFAAAPKWTGSFSPEFKIYDSAPGIVYLSGEALYQSHQSYDQFSGRGQVGPVAAGQDAYAVVNGRLRFESERFVIAGWVKNIFNKYYNVYGSSIEGFGFDFFQPGPPRTYGIEGTLRF